MVEAVLVYVTAPDEETAARIARSAVEERLAACVNVIPNMRSFYRWEGYVQDEGEYLLLIKTNRDRVTALKERVVKLHPYDVPCVTVLPIADGHPPYLAWIQGETRLQETGSVDQE